MKIRIVSLIVACWSTPVLANDTLSAVIGGNLVYEKTDAVAMETETLRVSPETVNVEYTFRNLTDKTVKGSIAFPLQKLNSEDDTRGVFPSFLGGKDPLDFTVLESGKKKPAKMTVKKEGGLEGKNDPKATDFDLKIDYVWEQSFPARSVVNLKQSYKSLMASGTLDESDEEEKKRYCIDKQFLAALQKLKGNVAKKLKLSKEAIKEGELSEHMHYHSYGYFAYILKTANNWAGPIKKFSLVVEKDRPSTLVSFCWDGPVKKESALRFKMEKENFGPSSDLAILFVQEK